MYADLYARVYSCVVSCYRFVPFSFVFAVRRGVQNEEDIVRAMMI